MIQFPGMEKGDAESGVSPQSCDQTQSRRVIDIGHRIAKHNLLNIYEVYQ